MSESTEELELVRRAQGGDEQALAGLMTQHRDRLRAMVNLRMNARLRGRVDPSDVVQDAYLEATRVLDQYLANPSMPFFLWLRHLTGEKLIHAHRQHLGAQKRTANREVSLDGGLPEATSDSIAAQLMGRIPSPSHLAMRAEQKMRLQKALNSMQPMDREVLVLRHFEHLSGPETAQVLNISHEAVKKRYIRVLERLESILNSFSEF